MRRALVPAIILMLALPVAALPVNTLSVEGLHFDGMTSLHGQMVFVDSGDRDQNAGTPIDGFSLQASRVEFEIDWAETPMRVAGVAVIPQDTGTDRFDGVDVGLATVHAGILSHVFVVPLDGSKAPQVTVTSRGGTAQADHQAHESTQWLYSDHRRPLSSEPGAAIFATGPDTRVVVEGDFVLTVWDLEFTATDRAGESQYWTGERSDPIDPEGLAGPVRMQQAYLTVRDGRLELDLGNKDAALAGIARAEVATDGSVSLQDARGELYSTSGRVTLNGQDVHVTGPAMVTTSVDDGRLTTHLLDARGLRVEGQAIQLSSAVGGFATPPWMLLVLLAGTIATAVALRTRHRNAWHQLQVAMENGQYDVVARDGKRFTRGRRSGDAAILVSTACIRDGRAQEALECLAKDRRLSPSQAASKSYVQAMAYAVIGQVDQARHSLQECLRIEPGMRNEARHNAFLCDLLADRHDGHDCDVA